MKVFREYLSFWNEGGLVATGLMCIGYFGYRGMLGNLPLFLTVIGILISAALAFLIANAQAPQEDDFAYDRPKHHQLDTFIKFFLMFLWGMVIFMTLGTIV